MSQLATDMELHFLRTQNKALKETITSYEQVFQNAIMRARQAQLEVPDMGATPDDPLGVKVPGRPPMTEGQQKALLDNTVAGIMP